MPLTGEIGRAYHRDYMRRRRTAARAARPATPREAELERQVVELRSLVAALKAELMEARAKLLEEAE
jgi:hypothetical protein